MRHNALPPFPRRLWCGKTPGGFPDSARRQISEVRIQKTEARVFSLLIVDCLPSAGPTVAGQCRTSLAAPVAPASPFKPLHPGGGSPASFQAHYSVDGDKASQIEGQFIPEPPAICLAPAHASPTYALPDLKPACRPGLASSAGRARHSPAGRSGRMAWSRNRLLSRCVAPAPYLCFAPWQ